MSALLEQLCVNTFTTSDLHRRLGLLQECLEEVLYHKDEELSELTLSNRAYLYAQKVGTPSDAQALTAWHEELWSTFSTQTLVDQITALRQESEQLPELTLYVPVVFDDEALQLIGLWVREHTTKNMMLDIIVDPTVVGGCAFVSDDVYHDLSLRHAFSAHKGIVSELLTSYV